MGRTVRSILTDERVEHFASVDIPDAGGAIPRCRDDLIAAEDPVGGNNGTAVTALELADGCAKRRRTLR